MIEWLLAVNAAFLLGLLIVAALLQRFARSSAVQLAVLARSVSASARVTSTTSVARDRVHLVLMDPTERAVDYVMVIDPAQRSQTVTHGSRTYGCISGSVDEGYFVYRRG